MQYDFTSILERRGKDALAVDLIGMPGQMSAPQAGFVFRDAKRSSPSTPTPARVWRH